MRVLAEFQRGTAPGRHGYPEANMFDQPELEKILAANLDRHPTVTRRGNTEVTALTQDDPGRSGSTSSTETPGNRYGTRPVRPRL